MSYSSFYIQDAAIRYSDGEIYQGSRHADCLIKAIKTGKYERLDRPEQGFLIIDMRANGSIKLFADRAKSKEIAINSGQLRSDHNGELFSEDLWPIICPKCHSHDGYYEKWILAHTYYYDFNGNGQGEADDPLDIRGGKRKFCMSCYADITKRLETANE